MLQHISLSFFRSRVMVGATALVVMAAIFSGCSSSQPSLSETDDKAPGMTTEKSGDTTLSGKLTNRGGKYFLEATGKQPQEVDSYAVNLSTYVDQNVTITGQFSGDTLFAGTVAAQ
jgi:hypothetical protein